MNPFLYREFAELAYALAKTDGRIQGKELEAFREIMIKEVGEDAWIATDWLDILHQNANPTIKEAYNNVFHILRMNKVEITPHLKERYLRMLTGIAEACGGVDEREAFLIARFEEDLNKLMQS
jgi:uncharacterized tellurite resistance protein B-like protein